MASKTRRHGRTVLVLTVLLATGLWGRGETASFFGGFFGPVKAQDPGRRELRHEFNGPGEERLVLPLSCGGTLSVRGYAASEQQVPPGWPSGSFQEWRSLIFEPSTDQDAGPPFIQSVSKVTCCPDETWLPEADPQVLALNYPKTLSAAVAAALKSFKISSPKILVIGLGSGAVPLWLAEQFPESQVDVVELEATVISAASEKLGFPIHLPGDPDATSPLRRKMAKRLKAIEGDGAALAESWTKDGAVQRCYDAVLIDAYDALNRVPAPLWKDDGPLVKALPSLLQKRAVLAANVPPGFPTSSMLRSFQGVLGATDSVKGLKPKPPPPALTFEVPETMNTIAVVLRGMEEVDDPLWRLRGEAQKMVDGQECLIDAAMRQVRRPLTQQKWQDAVSFLQASLRRRKLPTLATYTSVMSACSKQFQWQLAASLMDDLRGRALQPDLVTQNAELWALAKGRQWQMSLQRFRMTSEKNSSTFGALMDVFANNAMWQKAFHMAELMHQHSVRSNLITYNLLLNACEKSSEWRYALHLYSTPRSTSHLPRDPDVVSLNSTLGALVNSSCWREVLELFTEAPQDLPMTHITMNNLLMAYSAALRWQQAIHCWQGFRMEKNVESSEATFGILMDVMGAPGVDWRYSLQLLDCAGGAGSDGRNVVLYTSALKVLTRARQWQNALKMFEEMKDLQVTPNLLTLDVAMSAATSTESWQKAMLLLNSFGTTPGCGALQELREVLELNAKREEAQASLRAMSRLMRQMLSQPIMGQEKPICAISQFVEDLSLPPAMLQRRVLTPAMSHGLEVEGLSLAHETATVPCLLTCCLFKQIAKHKV
eukprot:symbB.v1.2.027558.t1/scaffold2837.1/size82616/4